MKKQIEYYLNLISQEIEENLSTEFDLTQIKFEGFKTFDFVNFQLIHSYILDDKKNDFFISIPEDDYRPNFFCSIFHSLVLIKLYQNYFSYEKTKPELIKGDLIYTKYQNKKRVCEIKNINYGNIKINLKFPERNEHIYNFELKGRNYTKINPNLSNGRNTAKNIDNYSNFLSENFGMDFPFITDFKNRTIVIADQKFFNESKHLPIRYTNKNGKIRNDLPFFNYLIECCNNFDTAKKFLLKSGQTYDEIIVIGDSKYLNSFDSILQEAKYQGKVKNIVLIGSLKPNTPNEFTEWLWSNDETKLANNELPNLPRKIVLKNEELYSKLIELKNEIDSIKDESSVNLSFLLKYTNFYFRIIVTNSNFSKGIYQEYTERLENYFKSDDFEEELNNLFYNKDIYNSEIIKGYTDRIFSIFSGISQILEKENLKWDYIKEKSKELNSLFLIVEKKSYDVIQSQIKREQIQNIKLICERRIDSGKEYLDKWLNDAKNSEKKTIIIPYLNNVALFNKLKSIKGTCEILCYENIDEISYDKIEGNYHNEEANRLSHQDRKRFFKSNFQFTNKAKKRELDDIFNFNLDNENFQNNSYDSIDLPKGKATYEITFANGSTEKFDSTKGVFLVENDDLIKTTIGEIYEDSIIRFYQNTTPKEFTKILKIFDTEDLLSSFDTYSSGWKETLKKLAFQFNGIENLYNKLFNETYKINFNTFRLYFDESSQTRFPRIKTLEVIKEFCLSNNQSEELIATEFEKFKIYSKKDHSVRQQAGRILGNDLLDYVASNRSEVSDSLKKLPQDILDKLIETIQEKKVIKKTLLDDE
ncbi:hypothetical protein MASR2M47_27900 [Draconibacterium sp.]|jgi:hypothetical protein